MQFLKALNNNVKPNHRFNRTLNTLRVFAPVNLNVRMMKTPLYLITLILLLIPSSVISANKDDVAQMELIKKSIPPLLIFGAGSVTRIEIILHKDGIEKSLIINNKEIIGIISSTLREIIMLDNFQIGKQFHQPNIGLDIMLILKDKDPIHLNWIGMSMFWITWNEKMRKNNKSINFHSKEFERVFFTWSFLNTLSSD